MFLDLGFVHVFRPMLLNWACSLRARGIKMPPHLLFVTSEKLRAFVASLGFTALCESGPPLPPSAGASLVASLPM